MIISAHTRRESEIWQACDDLFAFANGSGGKIIIGVDDKTREIRGIDDKVRDRIYDEFPNSLYDSTSPPLLAEVYEKRFDDAHVPLS